MLISCIMPTKGRPEFARQAIAMFQRQTWPDKELIIVDDADNPSFPDLARRSGGYLIHLEPLENIRYSVLPSMVPLGSKRNDAIAHSDGVVIAHWDDDDINGRRRLEDQIGQFSEGYDLIGYNPVLFVDGDDFLEYRSSHPRVVVGSSMMYRREYALAHPFDHVNVGEDVNFMLTTGSCLQIPAGENMICRTHPGNTSPRDCSGLSWRRVEQPDWYPMAVAA